ncbi:MAG: hypothetical protein IJU79_01400 [Desulfovibrionaceae bacterium]|nr:hypothetical protein [Desulfovibrionaceae bacterium]
MSTPSYVVSQIEGRVRLRHPIFQTEEGRATALDILQREKQIREIKPGHSSILVLFDPAFDLKKLWQELEAALPALSANKTSEKSLESLLGISARKLELRFLLCVTGFASLLGFVESGKAHVYTSVLFLILLSRHIWMRKQAM